MMPYRTRIRKKELKPLCHEPRGVAPAPWVHVLGARSSRRLSDDPAGAGEPGIQETGGCGRLATDDQPAFRYCIPLS
jgi:hypothetical protein